MNRQGTTAYTDLEGAPQMEASEQPEEVLKLINSAAQRYDAVRAALRYRGDGGAHKELRERIVNTEARRRAFLVSPREASEPIRHLEPDGPFGWSCRAWQVDEYHWRLEADRPDGWVNVHASSGRRPSRMAPPGPQYMA